MKTYSTHSFVNRWYTEQIKETKVQIFTREEHEHQSKVTAWNKQIRLETKPPLIIQKHTDSMKTACLPMRLCFLYLLSRCGVCCSFFLFLSDSHIESRIVWMCGKWLISGSSEDGNVTFQWEWWMCVGSRRGTEYQPFLSEPLYHCLSLEGLFDLGATFVKECY